MVAFGPLITWLGVSCALAGALLLLAAAGWGYGTVALRKSNIQMPTLARCP
jgi:hypothetical protein